jgi:tetratricopeptide (TPR) repeat protein
VKARVKPGKIKPLHSKAQGLIERAMALAEGDDTDEGLALLHRERTRLAEVPPDFDAAIGRLSLMAGRADDAVDYLSRARTGYGGKLPVQSRRALINALLRVGRIEAAGRDLSLMIDAGRQAKRPAQRAAIEAFHAKTGSDLDTGPVTPWHILARAEVLMEMKDRVAASTLLAEHRGDFDAVPDAYDAALSRTSLLCDDHAVALANLTKARDAARNGVSASVHKALGSLLFDAGEHEEASQELSLAMTEGAKVSRTAFRIAVASYRNNTGEGERIDTAFPRKRTLVDHERKLVYLSLGKNACTLLKATFVMNGVHREDYLASGWPIHHYCTKLTAEPLDREAIMGPDYFRFVVLREPMRRVLSAYLDKFVRKRNARDRRQMAETIRRAQEMAGVPYDAERSISFEEFVRFLAVVEDAEFNMHWMPQARSVGMDLSIYNHVGKVERLKETLDLLENRFGLVPELVTTKHMPTANKHVAKFSETSTLQNPHSALPEELATYDDGLPVPDMFFTAEIKELLQKRYADDVALYSRA